MGVSLEPEKPAPFLAGMGIKIRKKWVLGECGKNGYGYRYGAGTVIPVPEPTPYPYPICFEKI